MHGALIITPRKELCIQIYEEIRRLDPKESIRACRLGTTNTITPQITHEVGQKAANE